MMAQGLTARALVAGYGDALVLDALDLDVPQGRITDHRINLTLYKLDRAMEGDLDEVIDALQAEDQAARLAEFS